MITFLFGRREPQQSRSMENPAVPLSDPEEWLLDAWGGEKSASGVRVGARTALSYSPVWRATNLIGRDVGKLPLDVYRREGEGKERDREHPAYRLLRRKPNEWMSALSFRLCLQARALLVGNGYAYIYKDANGRAQEIIPLCSFHTCPVMVGGELWYLTKIDGEERKVPPSSVLHIRGLGDGIKGESVLSYARNTIGLGIAAERFGGSFFKNGLRPSATLESPGKLTDDAKAELRRTVEQYHMGLEDKHRFLVLQQGLKINPWSVTAEEAQFLQTLQQNVRMVANWFGVPPHKLGDTTRTAFASLEQENRSYLDDALDPWLVTWEEECFDKLLSKEEKEQESHLVEFNRNALLRADTTSRSALYSSALQNGWMSRDEVRARENLNPIPGGEGAEFFIPKNMGMTGDPPPETPPAEPSPPAAGEEQQEETPKKKPDAGEAYAKELEGSHRRLLAEVLERMVRRVATQAKRHAGRPEDYSRFLEGMAASHGPVFLEACLPAVRAARAGLVLLHRLEAPEQAEKLLEGMARSFFEDLGGRLNLNDRTPAAVEKACERAEKDIPGWFAEHLMKGEPWIAR